LLKIYIAALKQSILDFMVKQYLKDISIFKNKTGKDRGYDTTTN